MGGNGSGHIVGFVTSHSLIKYALSIYKTNQCIILINLKKQQQQNIFLVYKATYLLYSRWCNDIKNFELSSRKKSEDLLKIFKMAA